MLSAIASRIFCLRRYVSTFDSVIDSGAFLASGDGIEDDRGSAEAERNGSGESGEAATVVFGRELAIVAGDSVLGRR
jgi:hypothetical protein